MPTNKSVLDIEDLPKILTFANKHKRDGCSTNCNHPFAIWQIDSIFFCRLFTAYNKLVLLRLMYKF